MINGGVGVFNLIPLRLHPTAKLIAKIDKNKSLDFISFWLARLAILFYY